MLDASWPRSGLRGPARSATFGERRRPFPPACRHVPPVTVLLDSRPTRVIQSTPYPEWAEDRWKGLASAIRSDLLAQWHSLLRELPELANVLGVPNQLRLVLDANVVIAEIRWMVKKRRKPDSRSALQEVLASGTVVAYAPPLLRAEVDRHLRNIADREGLQLDALLSAWSSFEPLLCFVEPPALLRPEERAVARDPNDVPFLELQVGIDAAAIYTEDADLDGMGAPVVGKGVMREMRSYARAASLSFTVRLGGVAVLTAGIAALAAVASAVRGGLGTVRRMPRWAQGLLAAAVCLLLMHPRTRTWLMARLRATGALAGEAVRELTPLILLAMERTRGASETAQQAWTAVSAALPTRAHLAAQALHVHVLAACASSKTPLTTEQVASLVATQGYRAGRAPSLAYLKRVLRAHPALIRTSDARWILRLA